MPIFTFIVFTLSFNLAEAYIWELNHTSCNSLRVESPFVLPAPRIINQASIVSCDGTKFRSIGSLPSINRFTYRLYKKHSNGGWSLIKTTSTDAVAQNYTGLQDGTYYVRIDVNGSDNVNVWPYNDPCGGSPPLGKRFNSNISDWSITPEATIGDPQVGFVLADNNFNNIFCKDDISNAGGIFMLTDLSPSIPNADLTTGETHYRIDICRIGVSGCSHWTSTYWQEGKVPDVVNLLTDVWQLHHNWTFWGGDYRVTLAIRQENCVSYRSLTTTFYVRDDNCREGKINLENLELTVYPNPSMDEIFFKGLPSHLTSIHYRILDISGRAVSSGILPAFNASVNVHNLQPGMYVIGLEIDGEMNTLRFVVAQ